MHSMLSRMIGPHNYVKNEACTVVTAGTTSWDAGSSRDEEADVPNNNWHRKRNDGCSPTNVRCRHRHISYIHTDKGDVLI